MNLPQRITFFCNPREPEKEKFIENLNEIKIPYTIIPTSGCSVLWERYENSNHSPMHYGPTEIKFSLDVLLRGVENEKTRR